MEGKVILIIIIILELGLALLYPTLPAACLFSDHPNDY